MILLYILILLIIIIAVLFLIPGRTSTFKNPQGHTLPGSIASLEKIIINGQEQWILIRGASNRNPVILFLHGGPGTTDMTLLRRFTSEMQKHFIVVTWDQRGAGKSFKAAKPPSCMNINQFILDVVELTKILRDRFNQEKIFLLGHSWGSVLGILTVQKYPDLFHAYIGVGQIINMDENEKISYEWTLEQAKKANDNRAVTKLIEIGKPPYTGKWQKKFMTERRLLGKYQGELFSNTKGAFPLYFVNLIRSTEYTIIDKVNFFRGIFNSVRLIQPELMKIDLNVTAPALKVPIFFVLGKHDYEAVSILAEQYFKKLNAPFKKLIWFEDSAHLPHIEENKKFNDLIINKVLPEVTQYSTKVI